MGSVQATSHVPAMIDTLPGVIQDYNTRAAHSLGERWRQSVPADAPAAAAQREGVYVRTPDDSGYAQAANTVRSLFANNLTNLFAGTLNALFSGDLTGLFAANLNVLADPRIVPEAPRPATGTAIVASATGWSQPEHWQAAMESFDYGATYGGLVSDWLRRSGVN